jgi:hypothetical protein
MWHYLHDQAFLELNLTPKMEALRFYETSIFTIWHGVASEDSK